MNIFSKRSIQKEILNVPSLFEYSKKKYIYCQSNLNKSHSKYSQKQKVLMIHADLRIFAIYCEYILLSLLF